GHEIVVASPEPEEMMKEPLRKMGAGYVRIPLERAGMDPLKDLRSIGGMTAAFLKVKPDVVLLYQIKAVLLGAIAAKRAGIPSKVVLVNGLGAVFGEDGFGSSWKGRLARKLYARSIGLVDTVVFQNPDDPETLRSLGIKQGRKEWRVVPGSG